MTPKPAPTAGDSSPCPGDTAAGDGGFSEAGLRKSLGKQTTAFRPLVPAEAARWGGVYAWPAFTAEDWKARIQWVQEKYIPGRARATREELESWLKERAGEARPMKEPSPEQEDPAVPEVDPKLLDSDGDGIPDVWERLFGLNPFDAADALEDADGDGLSNFEEHARKSDPRQRTVRKLVDENSPGIHTKFQIRKLPSLADILDGLDPGKKPVDPKPVLPLPPGNQKNR